MNRIVTLTQAQWLDIYCAIKSALHTNEALQKECEKFEDAENAMYWESQANHLKEALEQFKAYKCTEDKNK